MAMLDLSPVETRILGCLLEKERTVPESYPLTLNSLLTACNQTTNRDPVTAYDEKTVENGIASLRERKLATALFGSGSRVQKYRHNILDHFTLDRQDVAVIAALLLRGPQTAGELRSRTERLFHFASLEELESCLAGLQAGDSPMIRLLPQQPGQKERRYVQLLSAEPEGGWQISPPPQAPPLRNAGQTQSLDGEMAALRAEVAELKAQFADFKRQFE
jgi:uncharacterized protein YceH (UPF0502 family)